MSRLRAALAAVALSAALVVPAVGSGPDEVLTRAAPPAADVGRAAVRPAPADGAYEEALASGVLRADPRTGCLWLQDEAGTATVQLVLQGDAYRVDLAAAPPAVVDGDTVVGRVGDRIEVGGGVSESETGVEGCPVRTSVFVGYFFERPRD